MNQKEVLEKNYKEWCSKTKDELLAGAAFALTSVMPLLVALDPKNNGQSALWLFILTVCGVDGEISPKESKFVADLFGLQWKKGESLAKVQLEAEEQKNSEEILDKLFDSSDINTKAYLLTLTLCLAAVDKKFTDKEKEFVERLLA